jgi:hypothetical protein
LHHGKEDYTNVIVTSGQLGWTVVDAKHTEKREKEEERNLCYCCHRRVMINAEVGHVVQYL